MSNKDFFELVKAIGESKSKQEEDRIIAEEVGNSTHFIVDLRNIAYLLYPPRVILLF